MVDYTSIGGLNYGFGMANILLNSCQFRMFRWDQGNDVATLDAQLNVIVDFS